MVKNPKLKGFFTAVWEIRQKYGRAFLTKKMLAEAYDLYVEAGKNKEKFADLLKEKFCIRQER